MSAGTRRFANNTVGFGTVGGGEFVGSTHVPFIGIYGAASSGGFAVDALLRTEYYQTALDAPIANVLNQNVDAHGWTFATSASYQWAVPNTNWFIEPSAGLLVSQTKVDSLNFLTAGAGSGDSFPGTLTIGTVHSDIGRVGLRFGESIESGNVIYQPFGAVSVWHEFGSNLNANFASAPGFAATGFAGFPGPPNGPATVTSAGVDFDIRHLRAILSRHCRSGWDHRLVRVHSRGLPRRI